MGGTVESTNSRAWVVTFASLAIASGSISTLYWWLLHDMRWGRNLSRYLQVPMSALAALAEVYLFLFSVAVWFGAYGVNYRPVPDGETEEAVLNFGCILALMVSTLGGILGFFELPFNAPHGEDKTSVPDTWYELMMATVRMQYGRFSGKNSTSVRDLVFSVFTSFIWSALTCALFSMYLTKTISTSWTRWIVTLVCAGFVPILLGLWTGLWKAVAEMSSNGQDTAVNLAHTVHAHAALLHSAVCGYLGYVLLSRQNLNDLFEGNRVDRDVLASILGIYAAIVIADSYYTAWQWRGESRKGSRYSSV